MDRIIDAKYRVLEALPRTAGRQRFLVSDLISGRMAVLESVSLEEFDAMQKRWTRYWQLILRERAARFAKHASFVPVIAVGAWESGPYYVYENDDGEALQGQAMAELPSVQHLRVLLQDIQSMCALGDHVLNLRPESLCFHDERLRVLPAAYVLPLELLARSGVRSPYQPPELRHSGMLGPSTDAYIVASVLQACAERQPGVRPPGWGALQALLNLEPWRRPGLDEELSRLEADAEPATPAPRRSVERLLELEPLEGGRWQPVMAALDAAMAQLSEGSSVVLVVEEPAAGPGLPALFMHLRASLALLNERPHVVRVDALTCLDTRDLAGRGPAVILVPDYRPAEAEFLPLESLLSQERIRPAVWVVGVRSPWASADGDSTRSAVEWFRARCGADVSVAAVVAEIGAADLPTPPVSAAARHLLDLLSVLDTDATTEMLRLALPQQEDELPEALAELERLGHVQRSLEGGGWWGAEPRVVLRLLRPDALELRRRGLTAHRREELHLLLSHLLADLGPPTLAQRSMRFHHLFAGGSWDGAAEECGALLQGLQRRGLETLLRLLQRKLVNSNLAHHVPVTQLLEVLRQLGRWEVERNRPSEGGSYYERAADKLFGLSDEDAAALDLQGTSDMLLAYGEILDRHGDFERSLELLQKYLDRFDERIPVLERSRLFTAMGYSEFRLGRFGPAEEHCQLALKLLDSRRHPQEAAQVYNVLGLVRWRTSRYEEAEQYLSSSLALRERSGDLLAVARAYNNLGLLARSRRRFPEALEYHRRSTEIRQEQGDTIGVARGTLNLAWVHFEMHDLARAEELAQRACALSDSFGSRASRAAAMGLLGEIYLTQERREDARAALEEAVHLAREGGDVPELFMDLRKQASLELRGGDLTRAEELLHESEQYMHQAGSPLEEAHWHLTYGELRLAQGDGRGAALSHEHAGNNLARLGDAPQAARVFLEAARLYHGSGVTARSRELAMRSRQLFEREAAVLPKELVDLEAELGEHERLPSGVPEATRAVATLLRASAAWATAGDEAQALEQILSEMRCFAAARFAILVRPDGEAHRASALAQELQQQGRRAADLLQERPRLVARAVRSLLPFSSEEREEQEAPGPFYALPLEAPRQVALGCILLEWSAGSRLPEAEVLHVLRALGQLVAPLVARQEGVPPSRGAPDETPWPVVQRDETSLDHIIGKSSKRQEIVDFIRQVRDLDATVLLLGENGTGKEVVARAVHFTGIRKTHPFVTVNCTAVPVGLWERELFGHERGAFTDAHETKRGYFESAHRGTLLLDEIGDMPWEMQTRFLRVLEEKAFTRIGGTEKIQVNVRIVAATNQSLKEAVDAGRFRRDLYHRVDVLTITLPPLRDRREDIPHLAQYFLDQQAQSLNLPPKRLSGEALRVLMQYPWLGNVRELENTMKKSLVLSEREILVPEDLPHEVLRGADGNEIAGALDMDEVARWVLDHAAYSAEKPLLDRLEREIATQLCQRLRVRAQAARLLGVSRPTLYAKLRS